MQQETSYEEAQESLSAKGWKWFGCVLAIGIVLVVAAFGDVMYLQLMSGKFPSGGPLLVMCYIGAFSSFLAVVYMLVGKTAIFSPGRQMIVAWFVFVAELAMIALNIMLVFQGTGNQTGFMDVWYQISPATPVLNMVGVAILFFLDEEQAERHEDMEHHIIMRKADRRYAKAMHKARLDLRYKQLQYTISALENAVNSPESLNFIAETATDMNRQLLSELSGRSYGTGLPAPAISHRSVAASISQVEAAQLDQTAVESAPVADRPKSASAEKGGESAQAETPFRGNAPEQQG